MAESYFKDPLLAKWERALDAASIERLKRATREHGDAIDVMLWARDELPLQHYMSLRIMIRAELSGARRAREKLEHYQVLASGYVGDEARGIERCAREILEAFDGE